MTSYGAPPKIAYWKDPTHLRNGLCKIYKDRFKKTLLWDAHSQVKAQFFLFYCQFHSDHSLTTLNRFTFLMKRAYMGGGGIAEDIFLDYLRSVNRAGDAPEGMEFNQFMDFFVSHLEVVCNEIEACE